MTRPENILCLMQHRDNIANCSTFEEFKAAQLRFLNLLVTDQNAMNEIDEAVTTFCSAAVTVTRSTQ